MTVAHARPSIKPAGAPKRNPDRRPGRLPAASGALAALLLPLALLAGCTGKGSPGASVRPAPAADGPVRIALLLPLSGAAARIGRSMENAAHMAVMESGNRRLAVLSFDTAGTAAGAAAAADRAVAAGARLIVGPLFRDGVAAAGRRAAAAGLNVIAFSNSESVAGGNVFLLSFLLRQQVDRVVRHAARNGIAGIGLLVPDTPTGRRVVAYAEAAARRHGAGIGRVGFYSGDMGSMEARIEAFAADPPYGAVLIHAAGDRLRTLAGLLAFNDVLPPDYRYLGTAAWNSPAIRADGNLRGAWFAAPAPEVSARFAERYEGVFGAPPAGRASLAYDAVALAATLAGRVGAGSGPGRDPFARPALTDPDGFLGADGIFRFTGAGLVERGLAVLEVRRRKFRTVGPARQSFAIGTN